MKKFLKLFALVTVTAVITAALVGCNAVTVNNGSTGGDTESKSGDASEVTSNVSEGDSEDFGDLFESNTASEGTGSESKTPTESKTESKAPASSSSSEASASSDTETGGLTITEPDDGGFGKIYD